MSYLKRIIYVLLGTFCLGLGVAFIKLSGLGQDALSALVFSIHYLIDLPFFSLISVIQGMSVNPSPT